VQNFGALEEIPAAAFLAGVGVFKDETALTGAVIGVTALGLSVGEVKGLEVVTSFGGLLIPVVPAGVSVGEVKGVEEVAGFVGVLIPPAPEGSPPLTGRAGAGVSFLEDRDGAGAALETITTGTTFLSISGFSSILDARVDMLEVEDFSTAASLEIALAKSDFLIGIGPESVFFSVVRVTLGTSTAAPPELDG
jgi:hypothetical protein